MITKQPVKQYAYIHALRILAVFFVIFNHAANNGFYLYTFCTPGSVPYWLYMAVSVFSKVSVPLFFMISGALLLHKSDETLKQLWGKRIVKILIPLVVFSLGYYLYTILSLKMPFRMKDFIVSFYSTGTMYHLWYMYAYIAFLACLPFLRNMVQTLPDKYFYYMIGIALLFTGILPSLEYFTTQGALRVNDYLRPTWLLATTVLYPCIGYFLQHRLTFPLKKKTIILLWCANVAGIVVSCLLTHTRAKWIGMVEQAETFHGYFVLLNSITLFCTAKQLLSKAKTEKFSFKVLQSVADCTFGIYLIHLLFKDRGFLVRFVEGMRAIGINAMLASLIYCGCIFIISYLITFCISKIPVVRKIVGL